MYPAFSEPARGRLGPKKVSSVKPSAAKRRLNRRETPPAHRVVVSQLKRARARGPSPNRVLLPSISAKQREKMKQRMKIGTMVHFAPPLQNGRRARALASGKILCFPDREMRFVAIDRSAGKKCGRALDEIEVVPQEDVIFHA